MGLSLIEDYYLWKKGKLTNKISQEKLAFFNTKPTDEQIEIMNNWQRRTNAVLLMLLFFAVIYGGAFGYMLGSGI